MPTGSAGRLETPATSVPSASPFSWPVLEEDEDLFACGASSLCSLLVAGQRRAQILVLSLQTHCHSSPHCYVPWEVDLFGPHQRAPWLSGFQLGPANEKTGQETWGGPDIRSASTALWDPRDGRSSQGGPFLRPLPACC